MSIKYDPDLEGSILPNIVYDGKPVKLKQRLDAKTQKYLRDYLIKIKNLQKLEYDIDDVDGEEKFNAFIKALQVLNKWMNNVEEVNLGTNNVKVRAPGITRILKQAKAIVYVEDKNHITRYYTLHHLSKINFNNIADVLTNLINLEDEYSGYNKGEEETTSTHNSEITPGKLNLPNKMGLLWFTEDHSQVLRTVPEGNVNDIDITLETNQVVSERKHTNGVLTRRYRRQTGGFFPYISKIPIDLSALQIFSEIKPENYKHNCFIYACKQSGLFTHEEIEYMCKIVITRNLPKKDIKHIAEEIKCNFRVLYVDETRPMKNQISIGVNTVKTLKQDYGRTVELYLYKDHYFLNKKLPITLFYIKNADEINEKYFNMPLKDRMRITRIGKTKPTFTSNLICPLKVLRKMFECDRFRPIENMEQEIIETQEYKNHLQDYNDLAYDEELCTRECKDIKKEKEFNYVIYADFESDITVNPHRAYLCCAVWEHDGVLMKKVFRGFDCGVHFINWCPHQSLIYFHNLKYDASFFMNVKPNDYHVKVIERCGNLMNVVFRRLKDGKTIVFRNSYSIIPAPLKQFASMFNLKVHKEICPYRVYTEKNIKNKWVDIEECIADIDTSFKSQGKNNDEAVNDFLDACENIGCLKEESDKVYVDILAYSEFYCLKDCQVLYQGMTSFNKDIAHLFEGNNQKWIGLENYLSVSSIGYHFALKYGCMDGCYELSGKPQDFISRCVSGGRTMCAKNEKIVIEKNIQDFDAVSLYPSAMYIMNGIPKGIPKVLSPEECTSKSFMDKVDDYFVEININKLKAKGVPEYRFPLVFSFENGSKIYRDKCYKNFYIDKRGLEDLIEFYDIEFDVLRGYFFNEGFNNKINEFIKKLFDLRKKYKDEGNPLQNTIKLLLNSIYGKSILKPIDTDISVVNPNKFERWVIQNYNFIKCATAYTGPDGKQKHIYAKMIKPINKHFNLPQFGVNVLSWSKHIMNQVMCLADQEGLDVYYQDTDSLHIGESDVPKLARAYKVRYGRDLIGKELTQFHCDFDPLAPGVPVHSRKLIALGKKSYLDLLEDDEGHTGYHMRMKGIPQNVIINHCKDQGITIEELYMRLYEGETIEFDLLNGANCFRKNKYYEQYTPESFRRKVRF